MESLGQHSEHKLTKNQSLPALDKTFFDSSVENKLSYEDFEIDFFRRSPNLANVPGIKDLIRANYNKHYSSTGDSIVAKPVAVISRAVEPVKHFNEIDWITAQNQQLHARRNREGYAGSTRFEKPILPVLPAITINYDETTVRADVEISRLAMVLYMGPEDRLLNIARTIGYIYNEDGKVSSGRNKISRKELYTALERFGITYHPEHFNRLIRQGHGIFWNVTRTHIFIASRGNVAARLTKLAAEAGLEAVYTNPPGTPDMLIPVSGDIERYYSFVYAAWFAYRSKVKLPRIARETLSMLFNRSDEQLRNYEKEHLINTLEVIQTSIQTKNVHLTDETFTSSITTRGETLYVKRASNTYKSSIRQHSKRGQARRTRRKVNAVYSDSNQSPEATGKPASRFNRRILKQHFERGDKDTLEVMKRAAKQADKYGIEVFIGLGFNRWNHNILEISGDGGADTHAFSRASIKAENAHFMRNPSVYQENKRRYAYSY